MQWNVERTGIGLLQIEEAERLWVHSGNGSVKCWPAWPAKL